MNSITVECYNCVSKDNDIPETDIGSGHVTAGCVDEQYSSTEFGAWSASQFVSDEYYIVDSCQKEIFHCDVGCTHYLDGCVTQLKPCAFFKEAYSAPRE